MVVRKETSKSAPAGNAESPLPTRPLLWKEAPRQLYGDTLLPGLAGRSAALQGPAAAPRWAYSSFQ